MIFWMGGPQLGEFEAGLLAALIGAQLSVVTRRCCNNRFCRNGGNAYSRLEKVSGNSQEGIARLSVHNKHFHVPISPNTSIQNCTIQKEYDRGYI
jgi:hypothetical protein